MARLLSIISFLAVATSIIQLKIFNWFVNFNNYIFCVLAITAKSVTYPGIGTFNSHDFFDPIHRPFTDLFLPQSPEHISPEFELFTRSTREFGEIIHWNNTESAKGSHFDGSKETKGKNNSLL